MTPTFEWIEVIHNYTPRCLEDDIIPALNRLLNFYIQYLAHNQNYPGIQENKKI